MRSPLIPWVSRVVRSSLTVVTAILLVTLLSLLAGCRSLVPLGIAIWLPLTGFLVGCVIMGVLSRLRAAHVILVALTLYIGAILLVTLIDFSWRSITLGPIELGAVADSWIVLPQAMFESIPLLQFLQNLALMASGWSAETILQRLIYNLVALSLFGVIGFILAGLAAFVGHRPSLYVVTAPEVTGAESSTSAPTVGASAEATVSASPLNVSTPPARPVAAPPPPTARKPSPPPAPAELPATPAPSAQAISTLKGKPTAHLKSTGQEVPAGQARCPFCHATIIPGSTFCNACQKQIV
jgi:hypothetical protein